MACCYPVVEEVVLKCQAALLFTFAQHQRCPEGYQQRRRVTNGRGITNVAAQRALVAYLQRSKALQQFAEVRVLGVEAVVRVGQRNSGADFKSVIKVLDAFHFSHVAEVDHHRQGAMKLCDLQRQVSAACQQMGLGMRFIRVGQVTDVQRQQAAFIVMA